MSYPFQNLTLVSLYRIFWLFLYYFYEKTCILVIYYCLLMRRRTIMLQCLSRLSSVQEVRCLTPSASQDFFFCSKNYPGGMCKGSPSL
jgi:hypothetical protein